MVTIVDLSGTGIPRAMLGSINAILKGKVPMLNTPETLPTIQARCFLKIDRGDYGRAKSRLWA